jgi:hypothetical protein
VGKVPFDGSDADILLRVMSEPPIRPRTLVPEVPVELETICLKCLEKDSGRRYPSAQALADDLERFLAG